MLFKLSGDSVDVMYSLQQSPLINRIHACMHQANPSAASANLNYLNPNDKAMEWTECTGIAMWVVSVKK